MKFLFLKTIFLNAFNDPCEVVHAACYAQRALFLAIYRRNAPKIDFASGNLEISKNREKIFLSVRVILSHEVHLVTKCELMSLFCSVSHATHDVFQALKRL